MDDPKTWIIGVVIFILLIWVGISAAIRIEVNEFKRLHNEAHKKEKLK